MINSIENKEELLKEFNSLRTTKERFDFWEQKLQRKYVFFLLSQGTHAAFRPNYRSQVEFYKDVLDFQIRPENSQETLEYNTLLLESYNFHFERFGSNRLLKLETLINEFEIELDEVKDKKAYIDFEIKRIEDLASEKSKDQNNGFTSEHTFFRHAYQEYLFKGIDIDLSDTPHNDLDTLIEYSNGATIAKYHKHLKSLTTEQSKTEQKKSERLTQDQQFLMLQYLGIFDKLNRIKDQTNEKKGEFVGLLIDKDTSNCRIMFSHLIDLKHGKTTSEKKKIKANLSKVASIFEKAGLKSIAKSVFDDLNSLSL